MKIQIVYPNCLDILEFDDLLEALGHVVKMGQQGNFMIKPSPNELWQDGAKMFRNFQRMFAPIEES
ncbi:MAG: hypothetical protein K0R18_400 [Bacillales bacterium]|jgi:hypothetical protein|nr:hypothetical protein [Bacillales bacterium]